MLSKKYFHSLNENNWGCDMAHSEKCYRCERDATSSEHVPPRCLFPEQKDSEGVNYRKNLITVPSCDEHNTGKSNDDQFLLVSLARIIGNNEIAQKLGNSKVKRTFSRTPHLIDSVFKWREEYTVAVGNENFDIVAGTPDAIRLECCFKSIFYGIYKHHFGKMFNGEIRIFMDFLDYLDENINNTKRYLSLRAPKDLEGKEFFGDNPNIFSYQFADPDYSNILLCKTTYYENIVVYGAFAIEEPKDLISILLKNGHRVVFNNDDGEQILIKGNKK